MPARSEKEHRLLPYEKDRRRKLTPAQREEIRANPEGLSERGLAARFGVNRRLISFILHPEKHAANLAARQARGGWRQYYDVEKHKEAMQSTRHHRRLILG